jgi:hypothetical protein
VIAGREAAYPVADFDHNAGAFVAADRRRHGRQPEGAQGIRWRRPTTAGRIRGGWPRGSSSTLGGIVGHVDVTGLRRRTELVKVVEGLVGVGVRPLGDRAVQGVAGAGVPPQY